MRPFFLGLILAIPTLLPAQTTKPLFTIQQVMIPVRDGVHLQTVIIAPADQKAPLPILFRRTPYGVPDKVTGHMPVSWVELAKDGYIFVIQNLRGRFKSEGNFELSSQVDLTNPKSTNETTDAYDSIDWLLKNVPNNNGKVGMYGVSYDGLTTALTLQTVGASGDMVPYRGAAPALQDIVGGHADLFYATPQQVVGVIRDGTVKAYGVTAKEPLKQLPQVPSMVTLLGPKLEVQFWQALFAPAATPAPVLDRLNAALREAMRDPALLKAWDDTGVLGYAEQYHTLAGAKALFRAEVERWGDVIRANKIEGPN